MRSLPLSLILLSGCITEANFGETAAEAGCQQGLACEEEGFEFVFDDLETCVDTVAPLFGGACFQEHCTFDADAANTCVAALRTADCDGESPVDDPNCGRVWTDCALVQLGLCVAGIGD